jgi:hypothetical protein
MKTLRTEVITINPTVAQLFLEKNSHNRPISSNSVQRYAAEMLGGRWKITGEPIQFSASGRLLDGQHRLLAVIQSGCSITCLVVRGIEDDAFSAIGQGIKRKPSDLLGLLGEKHTLTLAAALNILWKLRRGVTSTDRYAIPTTLVEEEFKRHPGLSQDVDYVRGCSSAIKLASGAWLSALYLIGSKTNQELAEKFLSSLGDGIGLEAGDPVLLYRSRILAQTSSKMRLHDTEKAAILVKAFNAHMTGKTIGQLRWTREGSAAENFPKVYGVNTLQ